MESFGKRGTHSHSHSHSTKHPRERAPSKTTVLLLEGRDRDLGEKMAHTPKFRKCLPLILLVFAHLASQILAEDGMFLSVFTFSS